MSDVFQDRFSDRKADSASAARAVPACVSTAALRLWKERAATLHLPMVSASMQPSIKVGDLLIVDHRAPVGVGDIIVFHRQAQLIAHRVQEVRIRHDQSEYVCQGDANAWKDEPVSEASLVGKVIALRREGRNVRIRKGAGVLNRMRRVRARVLPEFVRFWSLVFARLAGHRRRETVPSDRPE